MNKEKIEALKLQHAEIVESFKEKKRKAEITKKTKEERFQKARRELEKARTNLTSISAEEKNELNAIYVALMEAGSDAEEIMQLKNEEFEKKEKITDIEPVENAFFKDLEQ